MGVESGLQNYTEITNKHTPSTARGKLYRHQELHVYILGLLWLTCSSGSNCAQSLFMITLLHLYLKLFSKSLDCIFSYIQAHAIHMQHHPSHFPCTTSLNASECKWPLHICRMGGAAIVGLLFNGQPRLVFVGHMMTEVPFEQSQTTVPPWTSTGNINLYNSLSLTPYVRA